MAKQTVNNGDTGLVARTKINENFTELYDGRVTISKDQTFTTSIDFDVNEKYYEIYTQTETLNITVNSNTNGSASWQYIPLITNGNSINVPANWILIGANEYNQDAARYDVVVWFNGVDYMYKLYKVSELYTANPELLEAIILDASDDAINLTFNRPVNITTLGWSIATDGAALSISSVSGSGTTYPIFTLSRSVVGEETITISYVESTGDTEDLDNNPLEDITDFAVENRVEIDLATELGADLLRWYKDSRIPANRIDDNTGTPSCEEWIDSSTNASNAIQATKSLQPALNASGLKFDGTDDYLNDALTVGACEFFLVHKFDASTVANRRILAFANTNRCILRNSGGVTNMNLFSYGNSTQITASGLSSTDFNLIQAIIDGVDSELNEVEGDFGAGVMASTEFNIGAEIGGSNPTSDYLVEVIITELLSASDRAKVIAHLNQVINA